MKEIGRFWTLRFSAKSWGIDERETIKIAFQKINQIAPGLLQRAVAFRPIQLFRTSHLGIDVAHAEADFIRNGIILPDKFFQVSYKNIMTPKLIHELVHLVKRSQWRRFNKPWEALIQPRFKRVWRALEEKGESFDSQCKTLEQGNEFLNRYDYLARKEGMPDMYAFQNFEEALTVSIEHMFMGFQLPDDIKTFINTHCLSTPYQPDALVLDYNRAISFYAEGRFNESLKAFSHLQTIDPDFGYHYANFRVKVLIAKGDLDQALAELTELGERYTPTQGFYIEMGDLYKWKNNYDQAEKNYSEAIRLWPTTKDGYLARGNIRSLKKNYDQSIEDYTKTIEICPGYSKAFLSRAATWGSKKDYGKAEQDYNEVIRRDPQNSQAYSGRAGIRREMKKWKESVADYTILIDQNPEDFSSFVGRGKSRIGLKDFSGAITDFDAAMKILPMFFPELFFYRGQAYIEIGEYQKGIEDLKKAKGMLTLKKEAEEWILKAQEALAKQK